MGAQMCGGVVAETNDAVTVVTVEVAAPIKIAFEYLLCVRHFPAYFTYTSGVHIKLKSYNKQFATTNR